MPLMTKIRENMATFFSVFAGLFVVYIVLDWGMDITGRKQASRMAESQEVGKINGQPILSKDFSEMVRRALENEKAQTGTEPDDNQQRALRDQIWNQLVDQLLYEEEIERLGIKVTDQEIIDWLRGENPPEFLQQQFTDSTGIFNRQMYEQTIMDPRNKARMAVLEDALRKQRLREKLQSVIGATVQVTEADVRQKFEDQNIKYQAVYALLDPNVFVNDSDVTVTDGQLRRYFNENSDDYKVEATRKLKYVLFNEVPSKDDTQNVYDDVEDILSRAKSGVEFDTLANMYSETPQTDSYRGHGMMNSELENAVFSSKTGEIVGPVASSDGLHLIKVTEFRDTKDEYFRASHILIKIKDNDSATALSKARGILGTIRSGGDFAGLAKQHSEDPGSGPKGGDLGWFGKGRMVKPFEDAVMRTKPSEITGPIRTQHGYHIIKVHAKDKREAKYSDIHLPIRTSARTRSEIYQRSQDFVYLAKQESFEKEAQQSKYQIIESPPFQKDAVISGIGMNYSSPVNKFAFKNKTGTVSEPFSLQNGYGVFMVSESKEAGVRPFDEVKAAVESRLRREKKMEKVKAMAEELCKSITSSDSLQELTKKNPLIRIQHPEPFALTGYIPGVGRDLNFTGAISALKTGDISKPVESSRGVYIIKLLGKTPFDTTAYAAQKGGLRNQLLSEKKNRFFTEWSDQLKKSAEIVDNRDMFYR